MDPWFWWEFITRAYDVAASRGAPYSREDFIRDVSKYQAEANAMLPDLSQLPRDRVRAGAEGVLRMIAATVEAYHRKPDVTIGANVMVPVVPTVELRAKIEQSRFIEPHRELQAFECFLQTEMCVAGGIGIPTDLVLPVERGENSDRQLFGAPKAFQLNQMQLVNKTSEAWNLIGEHPSQLVRNGVLEYFQAHRNNGLESFVSLPVAPPVGRPHSCPKHVLAIVNIHSSKTFLLGWYSGNRQKLRLVLEPLLHILAQHIVLLHFPAGPEGNPRPGNSLQ